MQSDAPRRIPLSEPVLAGNEWRYVKECLDTGWVSSVGPFVSRFERAVADYAGAAHGVAVVNGTAGIHAALVAIGVRPDDEVLVPALTFVAPVNAVRYIGAHPVFIDADPGTWQMDAAKVARFLETECDRRDGRAVNRRTGRVVRAIVPAHLLGLACDIDTIVAAARRLGLAVVEDATEALGVRIGGRHAGSIGDAGVFSFNGNKVITTGGGGVVVSHDASFADRLRYLTTQAKDDALEYVHESVGFNYRLTNVLAAIGVAQLEQLPGFLARKRDIAAAYEAAFAHDARLEVMPRPAGLTSNHWLYTVRLAPGTTKARRQAVVAALNARGVLARPLWHTIHDLPPYREHQAFEVVHAPDLYARSISLPSGAGVSDDDVRFVIDALRDALAAA